MFCESVPFTVREICSLPPRVFPPLQVWVLVFEADVYARVWWAPTICQLCVFLSFSRRCHSCPSLFCFSFSSAFSLSALSSPPLACFPSLFPLLLHVPLPPFSPPPHYHPSSCPCLEGPTRGLWFVCWKAYQHHRRRHWNLSLFSLFSPSPCSLPFPSSLSSLSLFFPFSLFNVEVLSNCWLPLWLGGNGIFRRMPHAVASVHSWAPPP